MSELEDRRQRAREAAYDADPDSATMYYDRGSIESAIAVATRVKLTPEIIEAAGAADVEADGPELIARLVLEAAGFEVIELEGALSRAEATTLIERGEPDFLIDQHGDCWFRMEAGCYAMQGEGEAPARSTIEIAYGPVTEAWR